MLLCMPFFAYLWHRTVRNEHLATSFLSGLSGVRLPSQGNFVLN